MPQSPAYGWNATAGRWWHHLTGERHPGTRRPLALCGTSVRAAGDRVQQGYRECPRCARLRRIGGEG